MSPIGVDLKMGIFEVTMSGNFCLSEYTPEIEDNFIIKGDKKEIDTWKTDEELLEKANYYLKHDKEREEIAKRGHDKCRNNFTWTHRIKKILEFVGNRKNGKN
jgi:spore maturation protein CgeB